MKALDIIIKPVVTEKATSLADKKIYCFWVNRKATKIDIKMALKEIYGAEVNTVRLAYQRAKKRHFRQGIANKRAEMKKAFVSLKNKAKLDTTKFEKESGKEPKVIKTAKVKKASPAKSTKK
jgi:large subunit ribosomal protein L23